MEVKMERKIARRIKNWEMKMDRFKVGWERDFLACLKKYKKKVLKQINT